MTSRSSFLASSKENHKRRIWVWIISILAQIVLYPGIMTVYLSRIKSWHENGAYLTEELYKAELQGAARDAVGFQPNALAPITFLGVVIAMQGFLYLHDRKKVDMYHSVPVSAKKRFAVIYTNGILIYLVPNLLCMALALIMAAMQGALTGGVLAECGLAFLLNLLYFLVVYHTAALAVMLTGNVVITAFAVCVLLFIGYAVTTLGAVMKQSFFDTASFFFNHDIEYKFSVVAEYFIRIPELKRMTSFPRIMNTILPLYGKWFLFSLVLFALSYFTYLKRPAETAGKAIAFRAIIPFIKIILSVIGGLFLYDIVDSATYHNLFVAILCMIVGTLLCCAFMETIFEFDIRAAIKRPVSTGISAVLVAVIFCIYYFDLFGYDAYIPDVEKVESVAVNVGPYQVYVEWLDEEECINYVSAEHYYEDNMFLTDVEAVCELARKSQGITDGEDMLDARVICILYRLKSGREVSRRIIVDCADPTNEELLNRLIGTQEYREGYFQIVKDEVPFFKLQRRMQIRYMTGAVTSEIPSGDAARLREAWVKDMEEYDFSLARNNRLCGVLEWSLDDRYTRWELPVYESFTNTIAFLKEYNAYYPVNLRAQDIESLEITNYHYDDELVYAADAGSAEAILRAGGSRAYTESGTVREFFDDPQEVAEILANIYPQELDVFWNETDSKDKNYEIAITFKTDTDYPYGRGYYYYQFLNGQVPDFVVERTASAPQGN